MSADMIQIDMFEVQLGAGLLLQFKSADGETIRVLADAGVQASGYPLDHVQKKLPEATTSFDAGTSRIDLIIGTHYDADHLDGLVPVIEDRTHEIGEAWMPPVANDGELHAENEPVTPRRLLAMQFANEDGDEQLRKYLEVKRDICDQLKTIEDNASAAYSSLYERPIAEIDQILFQDDELRARDYRAGARTYFEAHLADTAKRLGEGEDAHDENLIDPQDLDTIIALLDKHSVRAVRPHRSPGPPFRGGIQEFFQERWELRQSSVLKDAHALANIRRAAAKDAINATSLADVVDALKRRNIPIRCYSIADGMPRRFVWQTEEKRFLPGAKLTSNGPELTLLGPSDGLIKKHWDRLPIADYMRFAAFATLPVKAITPSNQLSYVAVFRFSGQGILLSGDAGCVDFKPKPRGQSYYPDLIRQLTPLHVIQVAHHGGNNAHFYNSLLAANYPAQRDFSYLLLSHATEDRYRPSEEFARFIAEVRKDGDDVRLLFTSRPEKNKVADFRAIINMPVGPEGDVGDVRLEFDKGVWIVKKHAIRP